MDSGAFEGSIFGLPVLAPACTYLTLAPFIDAEEACAAANGDGRARDTSAEAQEDRLLMSRVGQHLYERKASAEHLAREVGEPLERVREQIANLEEAGLVVTIEEEGEDGETELFHHANTDFVDDDRWQLMSLAERQAASRQVASLVAVEIDQAIELGTFDVRVDRPPEPDVAAARRAGAGPDGDPLQGLHGLDRDTGGKRQPAATLRRPRHPRQQRQRPGDVRTADAGDARAAEGLRRG